MPELPEVETTRRGVEPHLRGRRVDHLVVRERRLRWRVPRRLDSELPGQRVLAVDRRAKYLLLRAETGCAILHLGMSGSLRILSADAPAQAHDHLDFVLDDGRCLRLRDPRRFGAALWTRGDPLRHRLLASLGPEPLSEHFEGGYLHAVARGRRLPVKALLMDSRVVSGVGNIYANEALFRAGVHPSRPAGRIACERYDRLAGAVKAVLAEAIEAGGTTLRDFTSSEGEPGYFRIRLEAYGRAGEPCTRCGATLRGRRIGQRASVFCAACQR